MDNLIIADKEFNSRLFIGTGKFSSNLIMGNAVASSCSELVTVSLKRINTKDENDDMLHHLNLPGVHLLPNTSGVRNAREAVLAANLAREALGTNWVKLEIHPDAKYLLPDGEETLKACYELSKNGFVVLPYIHADPVLCKKLEDVGAAAVMPLGSPIGSNQGLQTKSFLRIIIEQSKVPVVVDAGIGVPSHAAEAMEMGADAVLVNTAVAVADNPVVMADAFRHAVKAGRMAHLSGPGAERQFAEASSPLTSFITSL